MIEINSEISVLKKLDQIYKKYNFLNIIIPQKILDKMSKCSNMGKDHREIPKKFADLNELKFFLESNYWNNTNDLPPRFNSALNLTLQNNETIRNKGTDVLDPPTIITYVILLLF